MHFNSWLRRSSHDSDWLPKSLNKIIDISRGKIHQYANVSEVNFTITTLQETTSIFLSDMVLWSLHTAQSSSVSLNKAGYTKQRPISAVSGILFSVEIQVGPGFRLLFGEHCHLNNVFKWQRSST